MDEIVEVPQNYNIVVGIINNYPMVINVMSSHNLVYAYKDAVIGFKQFLTWESGCMEMKNVLGVYK